MGVKHRVDSIAAMRLTEEESIIKESLLRALINNETPEDEDVDKFNELIAQKERLREKLLRVAS